MKSGYVIQRKDGKYIHAGESGAPDNWQRGISHAYVFKVWTGYLSKGKGERAIAVEMVVRRKKKGRGNV